MVGWQVLYIGRYFAAPRRFSHLISSRLFFATYLLVEMKVYIGTLGRYLDYAARRGEARYKLNERSISQRRATTTSCPRAGFLHYIVVSAGKAYVRMNAATMAASPWNELEHHVAIGQAANRENCARETTARNIERPVTEAFATSSSSSSSLSSSTSPSLPFVSLTYK